jgi:RNA polymerase sigma-70 factor (ECF subfamily)
LAAERDVDLVAAALSGSDRAFRSLVERHHPVAFAVVRSIIGARDDVEDVVQEVFIKVYKGLSSYRGESKLSTWIYRIARNEALNAATRKRIEGDPIEEARIEAPTGSRPDTQFEKRAERSELETHLAHLDETQRTVLELRYLGERSYEEIAEILDLPIGTVKSHIHRAKIELKRVMMRSAGGSVDVRGKKVTT